MDSASAKIQIIDGRLVIRPARDGTHEHELVEHDLAVIEVAFGETIRLLEVERRNDMRIRD